MKRHKYNEPAPGTRPPVYVIVLAASDWSKEHNPANRFNLWDALHVGDDRHCELQPDTEPDLEAEP